MRIILIAAALISFVLIAGATAHGSAPTVSACDYCDYDGGAGGGTYYEPPPPVFGPIEFCYIIGCNQDQYCAIVGCYVAPSGACQIWYSSCA